MNAFKYFTDRHQTVVSFMITFPEVAIGEKDRRREADRQVLKSV